MEFSGEYRLPVGQQRVWEALNDPVVLQASIAGCKQLDKLSDTEFSAVVTSKVGSPFLSSSALVATVVPIFTHSTRVAPMGSSGRRPSRWRMPATAASR